MIAEVTSITKKHAVFTITLTTYLERERERETEREKMTVTDFFHLKQTTYIVKSTFHVLLEVPFRQKH
jgi:hypothetical protein